MTLYFLWAQLLLPRDYLLQILLARLIVTSPPSKLPLAHLISLAYVIRYNFVDCFVAFSVDRHFLSPLEKKMYHGTTGMLCILHISDSFEMKPCMKQFKSFCSLWRSRAAFLFFRYSSDKESMDIGSKVNLIDWEKFRTVIWAYGCDARVFISSLFM